MCVRPGRLKPRKNFLEEVDIVPLDDCPLHQEKSSGRDLGWRIWQTLNRIRTGVAPVKINKAGWNQVDREKQDKTVGKLHLYEPSLIARNRARCISSAPRVLVVFSRV